MESNGHCLLKTLSRLLSERPEKNSEKAAMEKATRPPRPVPNRSRRILNRPIINYADPGGRAV